MYEDEAERAQAQNESRAHAAIAQQAIQANYRAIAMNQQIAKQHQDMQKNRIKNVFGLR